MEKKSGPVIYWMNRELRAEDNWALFFALEKAKEHETHVEVVYNLVLDYHFGGYRQNLFKYETLSELEMLFREKNIPFTILVAENNQDSEAQLEKFLSRAEPRLMVTDFSPVRAQMEWVKKISKLPTALYMVDAHNIVPVWIASSKLEFAARTIRPKIYKHLDSFLEDFPKLLKQKGEHSFPKNDLEKVKNKLGEDTLYSPIFKGGKKYGDKRLKTFLEDGFEDYGEKRNDALADAQSNLSPYLHYGVLSPQRVVWDVLKKTNLSIEEVFSDKKNMASAKNSQGGGKRKTAAAFLEELVIRRELSDNYCFYNKKYDSFEGFPDWAKKTLDAERDAKREFIYTREEFENAGTHDDLWNAAQKEMVVTGKMHGYMRMYWAKKILEWTESPEDAQRIAIFLNDKYELDGRDPNGYVGIAWSVGGVHDRPWFGRPIFGTVRYMAESGAKKKFDTKAYIARWAEKS